MDLEYSAYCPVIFGVGAINQVGVEAKKLDIKKAMFVYDQIMKDLGTADKVIELLKAEGIDSVVFDKVVSDPPAHLCYEGAELAKKESVDGFIVIGGGSAIDLAKGINLMTTNSGKMSDYWYTNPNRPIQNPTWPLITIPTTSGTGSEVSVGSVITGEDGIKNAVESHPSLAIYDPELTVTVPPALTAGTGMDVFAHAAEGIVNNNYHPKGNIHSAAAIKLVMKWLPVAVKDGKNIEARTNLALASNLGGLVINESGSTFGHGFAHVMGAQFHLPHGDMCAIALPVVAKITALESPEKVRELGEAMGLELSSDLSPAQIGETVAQALNNFLREVGIKSLKEWGISRESLVERIDLGELLLADPSYGAYRTPKTPEFWAQWFVDLYDNYQ